MLIRKSGRVLINSGRKTTLVDHFSNSCSVNFDQVVASVQIEGLNFLLHSSNESLYRAFYETDFDGTTFLYYMWYMRVLFPILTAIDFDPPVLHLGGVLHYVPIHIHWYIDSSGLHCENQLLRSSMYVDRTQDVQHEDTHVVTYYTVAIKAYIREV